MRAIFKVTQPDFTNTAAGAEESPGTFAHAFAAAGMHECLRVCFECGHPPEHENMGMEGNTALSGSVQVSFDHRATNALPCCY